MIERAVIEAAAELVESGEDHLVATVVRVTGPCDRRPGARMIATTDRWIAGSVSAGCLEGDVMAKGWWVTRDGSAAVIAYDAEGDTVEILVERRCRELGVIDPLEVLARVDRTQVRAALATVLRADDPGVRVGSRVCVFGSELESDAFLPWQVRDALAFAADVALETGEDGPTVIGGCDVLIELVVPRPRLFILGAGHDALPVARLGRLLGWDVIVAAPHARPASRDRFAGVADQVVFGPTAVDLAARIDACLRAAVVIMGHDYALDRAQLAIALGTRARYIGVLGTRSRTDRMLAELGLAGDLRLHAPVGLPIGAETPGELAMAIVAEVQAALACDPSGALRSRARATG